MNRLVRRRRPRPLALLSILIAAVAALLALPLLSGCAGHHTGERHNNYVAGNTYSATNLTLTGTGTGSLAVTIGADGTSLTGTVQVTSSSGTAYSAPLTGTFSPDSGEFTVSGTYTDSTGASVAVSAAGNLPTDGATTGGSIYLTVGTTVYITTFGAAPEVDLGTTITQAAGWNVDSPAYIRPTKAWTVLVYMNAANNLEPYSQANLNQMEVVGSNANVNIVVQYKRLSETDSTGDANWSGTRRYYITKDSNTKHISSTLLSDNSGIDMGVAASLQDFIQWGLQTYPAQHYCLVVWNHGAGWRTQPVGRAVGSSSIGGATRGVSYDDLTGHHIDTTQIPAAIDMGNGRKWDLLAWDSSLMQMEEVGYQIRSEVQYIVGSEESPPGLGYPYHLWLADLETNPSWDAPTLGKDIAQQTLSFYQTATEPWYEDDWGQGSSVTQSVVDASQLASVATAVNTLGSALMSAKGTYGTAIANDRTATDSYDYPENRDLLNFTHLLATADSATGLTVTNNATVANAVSQVNSAVKAAVLYNVHGSAHAGSNGLAILLTDPADYQEIDSEQASGEGPGNGNVRYSQLDFASAAPNWQNFLANGPK